MFYTGKERCFCCEIHFFENVENVYRLQFIRTSRNVLCEGHDVWVRYIKCERCDVIFFNTKKPFSSKEKPKASYESDPVCCEDCRPIALKRKIERYDGVVPGTTEILQRLDKIDKKNEEILTKLNAILLRIENVENEKLIK